MDNKDEYLFNQSINETKYEERQVKKEKNNLAFKKKFYLIMFLAFLFFSISNYIKYYKQLHIVLPIELNDYAVSKIINNELMSKRIALFIMILIFFALVYLLRRKKIETYVNKRIQLIVIKAVYYCVLVFMLIIFIFGIFSSKKVNVNDWEISIETIAEKKSTLGGKHEIYHVILKESNEKITVSRENYKIYLMENDNVYVIYDKKNNKKIILSPKQYKYVGSKLINSSNEIYTKPIQRSNQAGYYLYLAILYSELSLCFLVLFLNILLNKKISYKK